MIIGVSKRDAKGRRNYSQAEIRHPFIMPDIIFKFSINFKVKKKKILTAVLWKTWVSKSPLMVCNLQQYQICQFISLYTCKRRCFIVYLNVKKINKHYETYYGFHIWNQQAHNLPWQLVMVVLQSVMVQLTPLLISIPTSVFFSPSFPDADCLPKS